MIETDKTQKGAVRGELRFPLWLLLADGLVYAGCVYYCALIVFFVRDGALPLGARLLTLAPAAAVFMVAAAARRTLGTAWLRLAALDVILFLFIAAWTPWKFAEIHTNKGLSFLWAAIEWWKLPANVVLMFRTAPVAFIVFFAAVVFLIDRVRRGNKIIPWAIIFVFTVYYIFRLAGMESGVRLPAYLFFALAPPAALFLGTRGYTRVFSRVMILDAPFVFTFLFYLGVVPVFSGRAPVADAGCRRIYPAAGQRAEFPLVFLRDLHADQGAGYLYTAYGPTSGIVRVRLSDGRADIIHNPGIVRVLWTTPDLPHVFALDWQFADFYRIGKKDFKIQRKTDIHDDVLITPMSYAIHEGKLYVVSTDSPALTRFDLATMKREARIDFRKQKLTKFRSGAWKCLLDPAREKLFIEMGPVDLRARYRMVRVDINTFKIDRSGYLPEGGLELALSPDGNSVLAPAFFTKNIYEVDADTLKIKRVLRGPRTCRNLVVDKKRNMLYATGYTRGDLNVIDFKSMKIIKTARIGKKPSSLTYTPENDTLYFGSRRGIFSLKIGDFLRDTSR